MEQTAIDNFIQELLKFGYLSEEDYPSYIIWGAKERERVQLMDSYNAGSRETEQGRNNAAQYYSEKYGKLLK